MLQTKPCSLSRSWYSSLAYWLPRSEWTTQAWPRLPLLDGHIQGIADQFGRHARRQATVTKTLSIDAYLDYLAMCVKSSFMQMKTALATMPQARRAASSPLTAHAVAP
jgi:hypothetical protein